MRVAATCKTGDGRVVALAAGAIIGRMRDAALVIDDPRVSEAHALIALRGGGLQLLALRGRVSVGGKPRTEVALIPGRRILLGGFFSLEVIDVELPEAVLAVVADPSGDDDAPVPMHGVLALTADGAVRPGFDPDAPAIVWSGPDGPVLRVAGSDVARALAAGDTFVVGEAGYRVVELSLASLESPATATAGRFDQALELVLFFDAVHVRVADRSVTFDGITARALSALVEVRCPLAWEEIARELWPDDALGPMVRQRWDQLLTRFRAKLRAAAIRSDLIRSNRHGLVELVLGPGDRIEDRS